MTIEIQSGRDTFLVAGVPLKRGTPIHYEEDHGTEQNFTAFTNYDSKTGKVTEIHTPRGRPVIRIHELLHARHTTNSRYKFVWSPLPEFAAQIMEDARIHLQFWPWPDGETPKIIMDDVYAYFKSEGDYIAARLEADPTMVASWQDFGTRLRMAAVLIGATGSTGFAAHVRFAGITEPQQKLAVNILAKLKTGMKEDELQAAKLLQSAFFPPPPPPERMFAGGDGDGGYSPWADQKLEIVSLNGIRQPRMQIIDMPKTEMVEGADIGLRRAASGGRMYRPALRRPLTPNTRLFLRRTPQEPGGTILIDASGSMGSMNNIAKWLKHAPFGQIAYYAGHGNIGWLWIFARNGVRAARPVIPPARGNLVDGPALTWLMQQAAPRLFVTDRGFCDAPDSDAQIARLARLEAQRELTVVNYNHDKPEGVDDDDEDDEDAVDYDEAGDEVER